MTFASNGYVIARRNPLGKNGFDPISPSFSPFHHDARPVRETALEGERKSARGNAVECTSVEEGGRELSKPFFFSQ